MTGSHDKTIRIWDVSAGKSKACLKGNEQGIWCIRYNPANMGQAVTASPEGVAKLWDLKAGKSTDVLKAHAKRVSNTDFSHAFKCYWASFNSNGTKIITCGSDRSLFLWDVKNTKAPIAKWTGKFERHFPQISDFTNRAIDSEATLVSCDWLKNDQYVISTSLEGHMNVHDPNTMARVNSLDQQQAEHKSNSLYCCC